MSERPLLYPIFDDEFQAITWTDASRSAYHAGFYGHENPYPEEKSFWEMGKVAAANSRLPMGQRF